MISRAQRYKIIYNIETLYEKNIANQRTILTNIRIVKQIMVVMISGYTAFSRTKKSAITKGEISNPRLI